MRPCPECGAEYSSALAAEECGEVDRVEDRRIRQSRKR